MVPATLIALDSMAMVRDLIVMYVAGSGPLLGVALLAAPLATSAFPGRGSPLSLAIDGTAVKVRPPTITDLESGTFGLPSAAMGATGAAV